MESRKLPMAEASGKEVYDEYGFEPRLPEIFDNSCASAFRQCLRKGYLRHVLGLKRDVIEHPLLFGSTWHKMHEAKAHGASDAICKAIADEFLPEFIDDRFNRTRARIKEAWDKYHEMYSGDKHEIIRVEQAADVYCPAGADCFLEGCDLHWGGKLDRIIRIQGRLWILDYKTSAYRDDYFGDKVILDHQLRGYGWMASHLLGERVWGVMIDRMVINSSMLIPKRYPHAISDGHFMSFVQSQRTLIKQIRELFDREAYNLSAWPENSDACFAWNKRCPYWDVCTTSPWPDTEGRLRIMRSDFVHEPYDFYNL